METENVVPDVIDAASGAVLEVQYEKDLDVNLGNILTPLQVKNHPTKISWPADPNKLYVLCMVDPDAPSRKLHFLREVRHYMVINIPGNDLRQGEILTEYAGSGPPKFTGLHRYVFLVYQQPESTGKLVLDESWLVNGNGNGGRMRFSIRQFAKKYNLGEPVAANFFQAGWDESVPTLMQTVMKMWKSE